MPKKKIITEKKGPILSENGTGVKVSFYRTIEADGEWVKAGIEITDSVESLETMDEKAELMWEKAEDQVENFLKDDEEEEEDPEEEDDEEEEITIDEINAMTKPELIALCQGTEGLDHIKTSQNLKKLRLAIIEELFEDEEEKEESDWEDTEWED